MLRMAARMIWVVDSWDRVIAAVMDRRGELGWTQQRLADEAGVSARTIQNLEQGTARPYPITRRKIEKALGWEPGAFRRIENEPDSEPEPEVPSEIVDAIDLAYPDDKAMRDALVEAFRQQVRSGTGTTGAGTAAGPGRHRRAV